MWPGLPGERILCPIQQSHYNDRKPEATAALRQAMRRTPDSFKRRIRAEIRKYEQQR